MSSARPPIVSVVPSAPKFLTFQKNLALKTLIKFLIKKKTFCFSLVKRAMHEWCLSHEGTAALGRSKPNGLEVREMFDPNLCQSGDSPLAVGSHPLKIEAMDAFHMSACSLCGPFQAIQEKCYFFIMRNTIVCGWQPLVDCPNIQQLYHTNGNYKTVELYRASVQKEFDKMVAAGVLVPAPSSMFGVVSPMSAVVKNSDKVRARIGTGIEVHDQQSLTAASAVLAQQGQPEIKARLAIDLSASGVNRAALTPPFRYPSLHDGLHIVTRDCWLAKGDVSRYFYQFPIAPQCFWLFMVQLWGILYFFTRCCFGFSPCPYYCSMWSAEFRSWMLASGIPCAHMQDDWLTVGATSAEAKYNIGRISSILTLVGFLMALEKEEIGQRIVFLGILINTITMRLSFEHMQCVAMTLELQQHLAILLAGHNLDRTTIRHVAGKLNWYAEVVQSGRLHIRSWWLYFKFVRDLRSPARIKLIEDTKWWIHVVATWGGGELTGIEYPIFSAGELLQEKKICVNQSDASGEDGFGYVHGYLEDDHPEYVSHAWDDIYQFINSHNGELQALLHFLRNTKLRSIVLLWVSDCLSAVWSINKGRCHDTVALETLSDILNLCDEYKIQLLALWVPREINEFQDYLSHLSMYLNRHDVTGFVGDLDISAEHRSGNCRSKALQSIVQHSGEIQSLVHRGGTGSIPTNVQVDSGVSMSACNQQQRVNSIDGQFKVHAEDVLSTTKSSMVGSDRIVQSTIAGTKTPIQGHDRRSKKESSPVALDSSDHGVVGLVSSIIAPTCTDVLSGAQWTAEKRRALVRDSSARHSVGSMFQGL